VITVFTLCSVNYLAHAKTLGASLIQHNPDYHFVIGVVDRIPGEIKPSFWHPFELLEVESLEVDVLAEMVQRYDVVELNTAVKSLFFKHLYQRDPSTEAVIYLDPDILVCAPFHELEENLRVHNIIVTPHSCTFDNSDTVIYYEQGMLGSGIYNLGFLATSRSETTMAFLDWWGYRLRAHCYYSSGSGLFVDQLWVTLAPLYFPVYVEKNPGYNMCYWNHFERQLTEGEGQYTVNGKHKLIFYHFSSYSPDKPDKITVRIKSKTASFAEHPELKPLYDEYRNRLLANGYLTMKSVPYALRRNPPKRNVTSGTAITDTLRTMLRALPRSFQVPLKRISQFTLNSFKTI
jgi:hypothetical protein